MPRTPDTTVVIPWAGDCPVRKAALGYVVHRVTGYCLPLTCNVNEYRGDTWSKALAVMPAVAASPKGGIVVVHDADVFFDSNLALQAAVDRVRGGAEWAIPHGSVYRLTSNASAQAMTGGPVPFLDTDEAPYTGVPGGGIVVARRETLLDVPLDPRFQGWGQEDESWGVALTHELGEPWRGDERLFHLWHPAQPRMSRNRGSVESWQLRRRYYNSRHQPGAMRALLEEAKDALAASNAVVRSHP